MSDTWKKQTKLVHSGTRRSQYGEVSEAIFMTQGFVYDTAEAAEARFIEAGEDEFIYARYGNPTVRMFEDRMAQLEGVEEITMKALDEGWFGIRLTCEQGTDLRADLYHMVSREGWVLRDLRNEERSLEDASVGLTRAREGQF